MADQSQQALEFKNWIRNVIAEEEKKRAVFNHSLLNEYNRYRNAFVDDDPEFNNAIFMELMSSSICFESLKLLREIYCCARDQSILSVMDLLSGYPFLSLFDDSKVIRPASVTLNIKSGENIGRRIKSEIRDSLDYHALDIRKRPTVYTNFFSRLLKPSVAVSESDPVLSTLGSKILGLVRYECTISNTKETEYSRVYSTYLQYIQEHIRYIMDKMTDEAALTKYLHSLQKDREGVMKLQEWIRNNSEGGSFSAGGTAVSNQNADESAEEDCDSDGYIGIVPSESGVTVNVLAANLARLIVSDGVDESYADKVLLKAMGTADPYDYEEEDKSIDWNDMPFTVKKEPSEIEEEDDSC